MTQPRGAGPSFTAQLDHVVIGANDLASGTKWTESRLGGVLDGGGKHTLIGNA